MTQLYIFNQGQEFPGRGNVCYALAALWARLVLDSPKDGWKAPSSDPMARLAALQDPIAKRRVVVEQAVFMARLARLRHNRSMAGLGGDAAVILAEQGYVNEGLALANVMVPVARSIAPEGIANLRSTVRSFGVDIFEMRHGIPWSKLPVKLQTARAHIVKFSTGGTKGHALGIYQTTGYLNSDFYAFDPNYGEYKLTGDAHLVRWLKAICEVTADYNNAAGGDVYELRAIA